MLERKFTTQELARCQGNLQRWRLPYEFERHVNYLGRRATNAIEASWWREAWEASQFARLRSMAGVRLSTAAENRDRGFDFEVRTLDERLVKFQSTLVDSGELVKRVREHKLGLKAAKGVYSWTPRRFGADLVLSQIAKQARKKATKPPRFPQTQLLLNVNMSVREEELSKVVAGYKSAVRSASSVYSSVWIYHHDKLSVVTRVE